MVIIPYSGTAPSSEIQSSSWLGYNSLQQKQSIIMSKRSIGNESSTTAHKRQARATVDDESPPPASLGHSPLSSFNPTQMSIDIHLIAAVILPFISDRVTWNNICCATKALCIAGKNLTPPWPNTTLHIIRGCDIPSFGFHAGICWNVIPNSWILFRSPGSLHRRPGMSILPLGMWLGIAFDFWLLNCVLGFYANNVISTHSSWYSIQTFKRNSDGF
jgi:hypothetical protein